MNILCVPPKSLTSQQKSALTKKGVIIIESTEPEKIKIITPEANIDSSDWFMAALYALTCKTPVGRQEHFVNDLFERLKNKKP